MATISIQVKNGQVVTSDAQEREIIQTPPYARDMKFEIESGNVQVTTNRRGAQDVIGGEIDAYAEGEKDIMTVEPANGSASEGINLFIKGTGDIRFSW